MRSSQGAIPSRQIHAYDARQEKAMSDLRIGVVGVRNIGRQHLRWATEAPGCRLVAVADRDPQRAASAAAEFTVPHRHADAAELIARDDLDVIAFAVPNHLHAPLAIAALEAGKHVLVEKPLARSVAEAERMAAAARAAGKLLAVSMNHRFEPSTHAAEAALAAGGIGRVTAVESRWIIPRPFEGLWQRGDWFLDVERAGGGPFLDNGVHKLDLALHLLGFPAIERVACVCAYGIGKAEAAKRGVRYEIEDGAGADVTLAGGIPLRFEVAIFSEREREVNETILRGERGTLVISGGAARIVAPDGSERELPVPAGRARSTHDHLARAIRGTEPLAIGVDAALPAQRFFAAAYESARRKQPVPLARAAGAAS
jgi:predicted dehydrogenase